MYRILSGSTRGLPDVEAFLRTLGGLDEHPLPAAAARLMGRSAWRVRAGGWT